MKKPFKFEYGQTVQVVASAPTPLQPGSQVAVVGMTELDQSRKFLDALYPVGTHFYLIEYPDGKSVEAPDEYLERMEEQ
jgi:hypothetical protein